MGVPILQDGSERQHKAVCGRRHRNRRDREGSAPEAAPTDPEPRIFKSGFELQLEKAIRMVWAVWAAASPKVRKEKRKKRARER